MFSTHLDNFLL